MEQIDMDLDSLESGHDTEAIVDARLKLNRIKSILGDQDYLILTLYLQGYDKELQETLSLSAIALKRKVERFQQVLIKHELQEFINNLFSPAEKFTDAS